MDVKVSDLERRYFDMKPVKSKHQSVPPDGSISPGVDLSGLFSGSSVTPDPGVSNTCSSSRVGAGKHSVK